MKCCGLAPARAIPLKINGLDGHHGNKRKSPSKEEPIKTTSGEGLTDCMFFGVGQIEGFSSPGLTVICH